MFHVDPRGWTTVHDVLPAGTVGGGGSTGISLASVSTIDICFSGEAAPYTATVKTGCSTGETTSATAAANGLP